MIKESELDRLSAPWAVVRATHLLSRQDTVVEDQGAAGNSPTDEGAITPELSFGLDVYEPILMKENVRLGQFSMQDQASYRGECPCDGDTFKGRGVQAGWGVAPALWTACVTHVHKPQNG